MPFVQEQSYGSIQPVEGCLPFDQAGRVASMALRVGGMIRLAWPFTATTKAKRSLIAELQVQYIP